MLTFAEAPECLLKALGLVDPGSLAGARVAEGPGQGLSFACGHFAHNGMQVHWRGPDGEKVAPGEGVLTLTGLEHPNAQQVIDACITLVDPYDEICHCACCHCVPHGGR